MARVVVETDSGEKVAEFAGLGEHEARFIRGAPENMRAHTMLTGLARAIEDAEVIQAGGDPERPSEKAMRLAEQRGGCHPAKEVRG